MKCCLEPVPSQLCLAAAISAQKNAMATLQCLSTLSTRWQYVSLRFWSGNHMRHRFQSLPYKVAMERRQDQCEARCRGWSNWSELGGVGGVGGVGGCRKWMECDLRCSFPKKFHAATLHFLVDMATSAKKTRVICCPGGNRNQATVTWKNMCLVCLVY